MEQDNNTCTIVFMVLMVMSGIPSINKHVIVIYQHDMTSQRTCLATAIALLTPATGTPCQLLSGYKVQDARPIYNCTGMLAKSSSVQGC